MSRSRRKRHARVRKAKARAYASWLAEVCRRPYLTFSIPPLSEEVLQRFRDAMKNPEVTASFRVPVFSADHAPLTWVEIQKSKEESPLFRAVFDALVEDRLKAIDTFERRLFPKEPRGFSIEGRGTKPVAK